MNEILKNRAKLEDLDKEIQDNLLILLEKINKVREKYGKPMKVNDGYRRPEDTPPNGAKHSQHLLGAAIDLDDNDSADLWKWCFNNLDFLKEVGLWLEDPRWTHGKIGTWQHFQINPPASDHRIFIPSTAPASAPEVWDGKYDRAFD